MREGERERNREKERDRQILIVFLKYLDNLKAPLIKWINIFYINSYTEYTSRIIPQVC